MQSTNTSITRRGSTVGGVLNDHPRCSPTHVTFSMAVYLQSIYSTTVLLILLLHSYSTKIVFCTITVYYYYLDILIV